MTRLPFLRTLCGAALLVVAGAAHAQDTQAVSREVTLFKMDTAQAAPATQAVSREVTLFKTDAGQAVPASQAVSREVTLFKMAADMPAPATQAVSREMTLFLTITPPATLAVSREVTLYLNLTVPNAVTALRVAAGLEKPTAAEYNVLNVVTAPPSANDLDDLDAAAVTYRAMHPGLTP